MIPDTNVLVRLIVDDDKQQVQLAKQAVASAERVEISMSALCETAWVLLRSYRMPKPAVAHGIRAIISAENVVTDDPAVEAGLEILDAGGDFADGVIAHQGRWLGGDEFVSFDKQAVTLLGKAGHTARLLTAHIAN